MRLRVLDGGRPGYAVLDFDAPLHDPTVSISVRSGLFHQGMFLGPAGDWQRTAHFFEATRLDGDGATTQYRVGPDVVNHVLEHDRIEVATRDGRIRAEGDWLNAVAQLPGAARTHTIYRAVPMAPVVAPPPVPK